MTPRVLNMDRHLHNIRVKVREEMLEVCRLLNVTLDELNELVTNDYDNLKKRYVKAIMAEAKKYG